MKNFRNLKGTKSLFRSESLHHLSFRDRKFLFKENKIKVVLDLRTIQEAGDKNDYIPDGVKYYHIPLITMEEMGAASEKEGKRKVIKEHKLPDIFEYYERLVYKERQDSWKKIFDLLLNEEGNILIHCTVGKDRSGIVSAMILLALGKSKEEVFEDYLLTNNSPVIPFSYKLFALSLDKEFRKEFMEYFKAKKEYLEHAFDYIDKTYGSIDLFLKDICGLNKTKIKMLKEKYCD